MRYNNVRHKDATRIIVSRHHRFEVQHGPLAAVLWLLLSASPSEASGSQIDSWGFKILLLRRIHSHKLVTVATVSAVPYVVPSRVQLMQSRAAWY